MFVTILDKKHQIYKIYQIKGIQSDMANLNANSPTQAALNIVRTIEGWNSDQKILNFYSICSYKLYLE